MTRRAQLERRRVERRAELVRLAERDRPLGQDNIWAEMLAEHDGRWDSAGQERQEASDGH
jgi:hypothetical protein